MLKITRPTNSTKTANTLDTGFSTVCSHIFLWSKFSSRPLLQPPPMHSWYSCYASPLVVKLLLLGEGIVGKVCKRKRTDRDRQTVAAAGAACYAAWTNATDLFL